MCIRDRYRQLCIRPVRVAVWLLSMNCFRHLKDVTPVWKMPDTITDLIKSFVRRLQHYVHSVLGRLYFPCVSHLFEKCLTQSLIWLSHLLGDCSIVYILSWVGYTSLVLLYSFCFNCEWQFCCWFISAVQWPQPWLQHWTDGKKVSAAFLSP